VNIDLRGSLEIDMVGFPSQKIFGNQTSIFETPFTISLLRNEAVLKEKQ